MRRTLGARIRRGGRSSPAFRRRTASRLASPRARKTTSSAVERALGVRGEAQGWGLGAVLHHLHEAGAFQGGVAREEACGVPVLPHAEEGEAEGEEVPDPGLHPLPGFLCG